MGDRTRAEHIHRDALRYLVYGFLIDRGANRDLFVIAHNVGRIIEHEFGCPMEYDEESDAYFSSARSTVFIRGWARPPPLPPQATALSAAPRTFSAITFPAVHTENTSARG